MDLLLAVLCEKYLHPIVDFGLSSYSTTEFQVKAEKQTTYFCIIFI